MGTFTGPVMDPVDATRAQKRNESPGTAHKVPEKVPECSPPIDAQPVSAGAPKCGVPKGKARGCCSNREPEGSLKRILRLPRSLALCKLTAQPLAASRRHVARSPSKGWRASCTSVRQRAAWYPAREPTERLARRTGDEGLAHPGDMGRRLPPGPLNAKAFPDGPEGLARPRGQTRVLKPRTTYRAGVIIPADRGEPLGA